MVALAALVALPACGSGGGGDDGSASPATPPPTTAAPATTAPVQRSAPRWETVGTYTGTGSQETPQFTILDRAIQWRVRWTCEGAGTFRVTTTPPPRRPGPIVDAACGGEGTGFAIHTGTVRLGIEAAGAWRAIVDQQVDIPLDEPAPAGQVVAQGAFYDLEKEGEGAALLYRLPDGRHALRLENFRTDENTDLFVWLSEAARPRTSAEAVAADYVQIGNLKSTLGSQNYELPASVAIDDVRSIVIWCEPVAIAYTAAPLSR
jgi:hypothetical protein